MKTYILPIIFTTLSIIVACSESDLPAPNTKIDTVIVYDTIVFVDTINTIDPIIRPGASPDNFIEEFKVPYEGTYIDGFIHIERNTILFYAPNNMNIESLAPIITISDSASISPASEQVVDLYNGMTYTVTAANGMEKHYNIGFYTPNLLLNPIGQNDGENWVVGVNCGTEIINDTDTVFYGFKDENYGVRISQEVFFSREYGNKYVLLIADMWTNSAIENSISGHPNLWAQQRGNFKEDDWSFLQGMGHKADANVWEVVYGIHELLPNITSLDLWMQQSSSARDELLGARNRFDDVEMRIFDSKQSAELYVDKLYKKSN